MMTEPEEVNASLDVSTNASADSSERRMYCFDSYEELKSFMVNYGKLNKFDMVVRSNDQKGKYPKVVFMCSKGGKFEG